ncbi:hypothetical protein [Streptomyces iconiensis]|uniref:Uncharacterized protein n=1 Tax=Streptomyces iconiensis TaxID=1384038 RepID=A0ABT6ZRS1_9ACTN|nr:hypothetical protein [Streptomyces iconiensis]MDJ1131753.1 hypothetical protein [Streptomyces iconiensis]
MTNQNTRAPRATLAVTGARSARRHLIRRDVIARQLTQIAPGTARVRTVPVRADDRLSTWVGLDDGLGHAITADRAAHRAAHGLLRRMFPGADWSRPHGYDATTGVLSIDEPTMPEELHG